MLGKRLISWLTYNVALGLLPFAMPVAFLWLADRLTVQTLVAAPGVFFFALMVSATSLRDIHEMLGPLPGDLRLLAFYYIFLLGVILSSIFYGCFLWDTVIRANCINILSGLLSFVSCCYLCLHF